MAGRVTPLPAILPDAQITVQSRLNDHPQAECQIPVSADT
jgi:hypothetical protein